MKAFRSAALCGLLLALAFASPLWADFTFGDASVWDSTVAPSATLVPIQGSGQINGEFTLDTYTGTMAGISAIQVGLRAQERFTGPVLPRTRNVYFADSGTSSGGPPPRATWNYDWHLDFGTSFLETDLGMALDPLNMRDFDVQLDFDTDPGAGTSFVTTDFNALLDSFSVGPDVRLFQSSQNIGFGGLGGPLDPTVPGIYTFRLTVAQGAMTFARSQIHVVVDGPATCDDPLISSTGGSGGAGVSITGTNLCIYTVRVTDFDTSETTLFEIPVGADGTGTEMGIQLPVNGLVEVGQLGIPAVNDSVLLEAPLTEIPTLGEWGLLLLSLMLAGTGILVLRR